MSDIDKFKEFYGVVKKPKMSAKEERVVGDMLTRIREHKSKDRKEEQY